LGYIAEGSVKQADRFASRINREFRTLSRQPLMGRSRPELATGVRSFPVGRYLIFYLPFQRESRSSVFSTARGTSSQPYGMMKTENPLARMRFGKILSRG
jgi:plasmid stabilization system protein ParE